MYENNGFNKIICYIKTFICYIMTFYVFSLDIELKSVTENFRRKTVKLHIIP